MFLYYAASHLKNEDSFTPVSTANYGVSVVIMVILSLLPLLLMHIVLINRD